jgi:hypothetical protein
LLLKRLLALAADPRNAEYERGEAVLTPTDVATWMGLPVVSAEGKWKGAVYFALGQIAEFSKEPNKFVIEPALEMPPGAPIGMPDNEFTF